MNSNLLTYRTRKTMINFELFLKKVQYSCLIEAFIDKLTCFNERPFVFSHDYKELQLISQYYEIDREMNKSKIGLINSQGVNYSVGECLKRLYAFNKAISDVTGSQIPSLSMNHHALSQQGEWGTGTAAQVLQHQRIEEDFASLVLQSQKAVIEMQRI